MCASDPKSLSALGFFTVLENDAVGLTGGYLLLNLAGRPLEFHCTAPVKPNRAQQILFGPTLHSYLYGEQIGQTLVGKGSLQPRLVCTDVALALSVRDYIELPVAFVAADNAPPASDFVANLIAFQIGRNPLAISSDHASDQQRIEDLAESLSTFDLREPFQRIREAVEEAHKVGRAA